MVIKAVMYPPAIPTIRLRTVRRGKKNMVATSFGSIRKLAEFTPIISRASICSVILMVPSSDEILEPTFPARISAIMVEENSSNNMSLTPTPISAR